MNDSPRIVLASASPRRRELLSLFDVDFEVLPADIDETIAASEAPRDYVSRMAERKAAAVALEPRGDWILGADTTVVLDGDVLGKPRDAAEATSMLERLSGRRHEVLSAVVLRAPRGWSACRISHTEVRLAELPADWIERYVASGEPLDKAGAYGIQGQAGIWVERLEGSYSGVVGLPLFETGQLLREVGIA